MPVEQLLAALVPELSPYLIEHDRWEVPEPLAKALVERSGVDPGHLKTMTLGGWTPWLLDKFSVRDFEAQEVFDTYVRQNSVLLRPGEAGRNHVTERHWRGPWMPGPAFRQRRCPVCATDPARPQALAWKLPLVTGCAEHGCRLIDDRDKRKLLLPEHERPQPIPVPEPLARLDRLTYEGLATGRVRLPGRPVHVAVWLRLLRSLLDEVSLLGRRQHTKQRLELIWQATGRGPRGGLSTWKPYELMDPLMQEAMRHAAAVALDLVAARRITADGEFASALATPPHTPVYEGDRPTPLVTAWRQAITEVTAAIDRARMDPTTAQQLLALATLSVRTLEHFERERDFLVELGIPTDFLPTTTEYATRLCPMCDNDVYAVIRKMDKRLDDLPVFLRGHGPSVRGRGIEPGGQDTSVGVVK